MQALSSQFSNRINRVWKAYERQLTRNPVMTQVTTSALLWGCGDVMAQRVGRVSKDDSFQKRRMVLTAGFGAGFGACGHYWYAGLDVVCRSLLKAGSPAFLCAKVAADTFLFSPIYILAFYAYGCYVIDGSGWKGFSHQVRQDFIATYLAELVIWPGFQTYNFVKVPVQHQLLAVNCVSLIDATFLSWSRCQEDWVHTMMTAIAAYRQPAEGPKAARARCVSRCLSSSSNRLRCGSAISGPPPAPAVAAAMPTPGLHHPVTDGGERRSRRVVCRGIAARTASHRVAAGLPDRPLGVPNHQLRGWESHLATDRGHVDTKLAMSRRPHLTALLTTACAEGHANLGFASAVPSVVSAGRHLASSPAQAGGPCTHAVA
ncbi:MAG: hypothetical protein WDW36_001483 [Sanguina aurantia]